MGRLWQVGRRGKGPLGFISPSTAAAASAAVLLFVSKDKQIQCQGWRRVLSAASAKVINNSWFFFVLLFLLSFSPLSNLHSHTDFLPDIIGKAEVTTKRRRSRRKKSLSLSSEESRGQFWTRFVSVQVSTGAPTVMMDGNGKLTGLETPPPPPGSRPRFRHAPPPFPSPPGSAHFFFTKYADKKKKKILLLLDFLSFLRREEWD